MHRGGERRTNHVARSTGRGEWEPDGMRHRCPWRTCHVGNEADRPVGRDPRGRASRSSSRPGSRRERHWRHRARSAARRRGGDVRGHGHSCFLGRGGRGRADGGVRPSERVALSCGTYARRHAEPSRCPRCCPATGTGRAPHPRLRAPRHDQPNRGAPSRHGAGVDLRTPAVRAWLEERRRIRFHCTPTSASRMNHVEEPERGRLARHLGRDRRRDPRRGRPQAVGDQRSRPVKACLRGA